MVDLNLSVEVTFKGRGLHRFLAVYKEKLPPAIDNKNINIAGRLTKQAKKNLRDTRLRPAEVGQRPRSRLTGTLAGGKGRRGAIRGSALQKGRTSAGNRRQGKGVGWPEIAVLDRKARHWRSLEFGTPFVTIPRGVFFRKGTAVSPGPRNRADVFFTYKEFLRKKGLRRGTTKQTIRQRRARQRAIHDADGKLLLTGSKGNGPNRGAGIEAKFFLKNAWDTVAGPKGEKAFGETIEVIDRVFRRFRS